MNYEIFISYYMGSFTCLADRRDTIEENRRLESMYLPTYAIQNSMVEPRGVLYAPSEPDDNIDRYSLVIRLGRNIGLASL